YRIVFTQIPAGVTLGESLNPPLPVRLTGYFFKRYGYVSRGGQHVAPMLIARTLSPIPPPVPTPADGPELRYTMIALISVIAAGVLTLAVWFFASDRRFRRSRLQQLAAARLDADP